MAQLKQGFGRTRLITLRLTPAEHQSVVKASKGSRSVSDYVRGVVVAQADADQHEDEWQRRARIKRINKQ